ncbi:LysR substrate-binding domain-containing protein [Polaromonas sp. SM01]|uniref:LysR substrate-binding domain-containing protein n=1 Tax=Polaromonas sp. SM01 TaxID=3085630 RepID=UPI002981604C|nr:LysR substrate-binding domain-containing protein [Polaromonas sp. SM01]MDW5444660.1 LysR substrate-binding domain-containing protein [Polaromonas sp. SM01]
MRYDLIDLKLVVAVADAGNVSRGAAACFLAPSSASLRIKHLEESLGAQLFTRNARGVSLTRAGQVMLEHCRRCFAELEQMHADLVPYADGVRAHVTLFANSSAIASFLPGDLELFLRSHPSVRVSLEERLSHDIVTAVVEGRADLGVVTWDDAHPELLFRPYREDELVVLAPVSLSIGSQGAVSLRECLDHPFVSMGSGSAIHTFIMSKAITLGQPMDVRIQVAGFPAVASLVKSGAGIGIVPRSVINNLKAEGLQVLSLQEPWATRLLRVCVRRDETRLSGYARDLWHLLCKDGSESEARDEAPGLRA